MVMKTMIENALSKYTPKTCLPEHDCGWIHSLPRPSSLASEEVIWQRQGACHGRPPGSPGFSIWGP